MPRAGDLPIWIARVEKIGGDVERARLLLVDDNDDFLDGVEAWLAHETTLDIVGRAHSGAEALDMVRRLKPDLVLMDVTMPDISGFEAARRIKSESVAPKIILLAFHESHAAEVEAWAAGADGFVAKVEITQRLMPIIRDLIRERSPQVKKIQPSPITEQGPPRDISK